MSTLVIHHSADLDGLCSCAVARHFLGDAATYLGWDYGQPIPNTAAYDTVYLIDVSFPREAMESRASKLIWIDHHKSAIAAMEGLSIPGYRIDGVAACRLAYQWFAREAIDNTKVPVNPLPLKDAYVTRSVAEPHAVRLLGEYDIWDKRDPDVDIFQLGMQAEKTPPWETLLDVAPDTIAQILDRGRAIQAYTEVTNAQVSQERGFDVQWEGLTFRALCTARCNSLTFTAALRPHHDACLAYHWNGRAWRFSLYHAPGKDHHDLSLIASKHGGGGHKGACGFELKVLPEVFGGFGGVT